VRMKVPEARGMLQAPIMLQGASSLESLLILQA
jgi:hypothetical protein